ncbi:hypothetical protein FTX61_14450 [Nitriliruptoraceae bacterium ZYF776]|nr:hypothetical protein [Profundirhabdus halotolerans]
MHADEPARGADLVENARRPVRSRHHGRPVRSTTSSTRPRQLQNPGLAPGSGPRAGPAPGTDAGNRLPSPGSGPRPAPEDGFSRPREAS